MLFRLNWTGLVRFDTWDFEDGLTEPRAQPVSFLGKTSGPFEHAIKAISDSGISNKNLGWLGLCVHHGAQHV